MKKLLIILCISFFACDAIIEVDDISEATVTILAPAKGVSLNEGDIAFTWNATEDAESYNIQIATPNFESATQILTDSIVTNTFFNSSLDASSYEWRVRAENSGYQTQYTAQNFTLLPTDPVDISNETVVIIAPGDDATFLTTDTINFSWEAIDDAEEYAIQIVTPNFDDPIEVIKNKTTTSTNFSVSNLSENQYEFRIKAKNSGYETEYTKIGFTVEDD